MPANFKLVEAARGLVPDDIILTEFYLDIGPASIESEFDELFAGPDVVIQAMQAEQDGAQAVIVLCMGDPGVHAAREACSIPIIGPGELSMHYAAMLGHKFSILPTLDRRVPTFEHHARLYGLESRLASSRPTNVPVLHIKEDTGLQQKLVAAAIAAVEQDGADLLILGCIGFRGVDTIIADALKNAGHDVPVIDALPLSIMTAVALVQCGLRHSKNAYPYPPGKHIEGYNIPVIFPKL